MTHHVRSGAKPVCGLVLLSVTLALTAADEPSWDHLLLVDFAPKSYRIRVDKEGYTRWDERGTFDSHMAISPTLRIRGHANDGDPALMLILGLTYGQYSTGDLQMEVVDWHAGAGVWWSLSEWTEISLHAQIGGGWTDVDLPDPVNRSSGRIDGSSESSNAAILANLAIHPQRNVTIAVTGGVSVRYDSEMRKYSYHTAFSNVISGGVLSAGIGLTF